MSAPPPPRDLLFEAEHLSLADAGNRGQPSAHILKGVSVAVERGSALVLVGPSGPGKSTLLQCLNRLVEPTGGRVRFDGHDVRSLDPRELRRRVALVMQTPVLFEGSVRGNLRVRPAGTPGDFSDASLASAAVEVGLDVGLLDRDAVTLSGGEKQRVTSARRSCATRHIGSINATPRPAPRAAGRQDPQGTPWSPGPSAAHRPARARLPR
jgi:ATP-binding cassette subfamily B protein